MNVPRQNKKPDSVSFLMNVRKRALAEVYRRGVLTLARSGHFS